MSDMIERVGAAIRAKLEDAGVILFNNLDLKIARAAIEAMREPTKEMQAAIPPQFYTIEHYHGSGHHQSFPTLGSGPIAAWKAMIDAALSQDTHSLPLTPEAARPADVEK